MHTQSLALEKMVSNQFDSKAQCIPINSIKTLPNVLWAQCILLFINNIDDLGHLAKTSKATRSLLLQFLKCNAELLDSLIQYSTKADKVIFVQSKRDAIATSVTMINTITEARRAELQEIENKRSIKKSTMARLLSFIPGSSLILSAIPKFLASDVGRKAGELALMTQLAPTCRNQKDDMVENIMELCAHSWSAYIERYSSMKCGCDYWSDPFITGDPSMSPMCNFTLCLEITNNLLKDGASNEWTGAWLAAGGIAAIMVAAIIFIRLGNLSNISIEKILLQPFVNIFNLDFQKEIREILGINRDDFNKLSVTEVISQLNKIEATALQEKNKLLCSMPIQTLKQTLFQTLHPGLEKKKENHVITIEENVASEDKNSLVTPLISRTSLSPR